MNLESLPSTQFYIQPDGYLPVEWQNFFSMNNQNMKLFFSNTGHLVPSRSNADVTLLSNAGLTDPTIYKARNLYNNDTNNFMGNVNGTYLNYTMHSFMDSRQLNSIYHPKKTIRYFSDENNNLYVNINGEFGNVPRVTSGTLNFEIRDNQLVAIINGSPFKLTLEALS